MNFIKSLFATALVVILTLFMLGINIFKVIIQFIGYLIGSIGYVFRFIGYVIRFIHNLFDQLIEYCNFYEYEKIMKVRKKSFLF